MKRSEEFAILDGFGQLFWMKRMCIMAKNLIGFIYSLHIPDKAIPTTITWR